MNTNSGRLSKSLAAFAATLSLCAAHAAAAAQEAPYPARTVTIVVPFPPGGSTDVISRLIAPHLSQSLGVPVIVEMQPGASGMLGAATVAKAKPDGSMILMVTPPILSSNQWLYRKMPYDPEKAFVPITDAAVTDNLIVVPASSPVHDLAELVALGRSQPGALSYASGGNGTSHHPCAEQLKKEAGIEMVHVPYKGVGPAHVDLLAGRVSRMCANISNVLRDVRAGKLRAIAAAARTRSALAPDVPTTGEQGYPDLLASVWFGYAAPAGTPPEVTHRLQRGIAEALHDEVVRKRIEGLGLVVVADTPEHFASFIHSETERYHHLVELSGARAD
jgi:tripartite-type tricarboxylate transporter receptor subunit TctC